MKSSLILLTILVWYQINVVRSVDDQCRFRVIPCDVNLKLAEERIKNHKEYDVQKAVKCCEKWQWIKCYEKVIKELGSENCNDAYLAKNSFNMTDCSAFEKESLMCEWPPWLHLVIFMVASVVVLVLIIVSLYAVHSRPKPTDVLPFDGKVEPKEGNEQMDNTTYEMDKGNTKIKSVSEYYINTDNTKLK